MANLSEVGETDQKTYRELFCSAELTAPIHLQLICLSALNVFLSIAACIGNTLILVALRKESSLHPPTKLLFRCLAASDLCVGLLSEPVTVVYWMSLVNERWEICRFALTSGVTSSLTLCSVSLVTLTALSVERLLALLLGLRYRQVVTLKRAYIAVTVFWVVSIVSTTTYFWNYLITIWYRYVGVLLCLLISTVSYASIFATLHQFHSHVQNGGQANQASQINLGRYRNALSSTLWLQFALIVCYLPFGITEALTSQKRLTSSFFVVREFAATLVFFNSSLNPFLYCWRIRGVRRAVKDTIRQICR